MKNLKDKAYSIQEIKQKLEYYCVYQDRCFKEVDEKLKSFFLIEAAKEEILIHLIENKYINEERFACSFVRGKHSYKNWGKIRLVNELKFRAISATVIKIALKEIDESHYLETFEVLAAKHWGSISESNLMKKRKKFCDYFMQKGWESELVYEKVKSLEIEDF